MPYEEQLRPHLWGAGTVRMCGHLDSQKVSRHFKGRPFLRLHLLNYFMADQPNLVGTINVKRV